MAKVLKRKLMIGDPLVKEYTLTEDGEYSRDFHSLLHYMDHRSDAYNKIVEARKAYLEAIWEGIAPHLNYDDTPSR